MLSTKISVDGTKFAIIFFVFFGKVSFFHNTYLFKWRMLTGLYKQETFEYVVWWSKDLNIVWGIKGIGLCICSNYFLI